MAAGGGSADKGGGGGKTGRQNPKSKITSLNSQLAELEAELAAVERDCAQIEEENRALLEQAQEREAEVERERAKIARTMPTATGTGSVGGQATQAGLDQGATQGAATAGGASPGVGGQAPAAASAAQGSANDPVLVIQSCPGCTFTVTRAMLEGSPRLDLERIYTALLQNIQSIAAQYRETENRLKSALLNSQDMSGAAGVHSSQLEAQLTAQSTSLEGPISDLLQLYAHAFRADAAQTDTMARRILASINPNRASAGAEKALRLSDELTRTLAQSVKRFLSIVTDCMERRKQLQANLRQPSDALLEWEAVAQWLRNDAVIGELQRVLAREADAYLDWAGYACTKVWPPIQASQILLSHVPAELFQLACRVLAPPTQASGGSAAHSQAPLSQPQVPIGAGQGGGHGGLAHGFMS